MGKALGTWILLSLFGFVGWNFAVPRFLPWAGNHPQGILVCGGIAAIGMIALILAGKNK
jgi:hypothetical protein